MSTSGNAMWPQASAVGASTTFRVLGPLEVWVGASRLEVGGRQEQALLALLLTAPGRVFSVAAIAAGLWGERPPGGADNTVMSYVSRLRRSLPDGVAATVVTRRPGYLIAIEPDQVDAELFRSLVGRGHRELAAGRPELAAESLREALGWWRGDAYAEFDAPFAVAERRALEELRLAALEDRVSAELDVGEAPDLVAELEAQVSAHPLRERLWAQLMTALYRSGRQADALRSYQRARSTLVDELGVEPGDELQDLHALVLAHDPRLLGPGTTRSRRAEPLGRGFVGRARELELFDEAYGRAKAGSSTRILLTGPHGMGKTRLLAEVARRARAAGVTVVDEPSRADPAGAPVLLVLDSLERSSVAELIELSEVLGAGPHPALVAGACVWDDLTSAQADALGRLFPDRLSLGRLSASEVAELVALYVPRPELDDAPEAADIVASGGVPLQVHAAAGRYAERLLAERIGTSAQAIADPRRQVAQSRAEVADGVTELSRVRALRQAHTSPETRRRVCPFKGLAYYDVDDAPYFAGRERLIARLVAGLVDAPLLAVVGASGSGKSSVVRAGLVAAISGGLLPGSDRWRVVVTTPARNAPDLPPAAEPGAEPRTLLVVDQLEEMFTALPRADQAGYAEWITAAAERDDVTVVVAIRSDYFARVVVHRRLADLLAANAVLVGAMSVDELREAVEVPAAAADLALEPGLAATIADDVVGEPGGLPLMSTALLSLWEHGDGRRLSLADYRETGGVRTAVARLAEGAIAPMTPKQQDHARRILLRLADVDDSGEPVRRRVALSELAVDDDPDARAALEVLAARRLLTVSATHAEVAHEALLREWPRLRGWLDDDEAGRRMRRHLVPAAAAWLSSARDPGELYRGQRLTAALDFVADHGDDLTDLERDFLLASRDAADTDAAARRRSHRRLQGLAAGLAVVLLLALGAGWVAVDRRNESARLAVEADVRALRAAALGEDRWDLALLYAAQAYRVDPSAQSRAALLRTVHRSPEATAMYTTDGRLLGLAVSADGQTLAGLGSAGTVDVWDVTTGARRSTMSGLTELGVTSLDLSPDGRYLAVVGIPVDAETYDFQQQLMVVDLDQTPPTVQTWGGPGIAAARFTGDGRTVVTVGIDGLIRAVDVPTGHMVQVGGPEVTVSDQTALDAPAGRRFMVAADADAPGVVTAWEAASGRVVWSSEVDGGAVASISPAGTALVLAHETGSVEHLDLVTGARRTVPSDPGVGFVDLDWAPDGSSFAGATTEGTVVLWDSTTLEPRSIFRGHSGTVSQVVHSADGASLYASGFDGAVVVWDLTRTRGVVMGMGTPAPAQRFGPFRAANRVLSTDGSLAVSYRDEGALELLDVGTATTTVVPVRVNGSPARVVVDPAGRHAAVLTVQWPRNLRAEIQVVDVASRSVLPYRIRLIADFLSPAPAFSGDGRTLVTADAEFVVVWDVQSGRTSAERTGYMARERIVSVATDATASIVAVGVIGGGVEVVDTATGERVTELVPPGGDNLATTPLAFSPDGKWLAGGSESGRVVVWDTATWDVQRTWLAVLGGGVDSLTFTPDSRAVVAGGAGTASVGDVDPRGATDMTLTLSALPSRSDVAAATRDEGRSVVTLTEDEGVQVWAISADALLEQACALAARPLTRAEWRTVLPNLPYEQTCPGR
ncbi:AAA family ATPase [Cellulomonas humilata]|uniref:AAA family ATPase n=1 Tax=Cellulomonas humilata TaxID=144055 RepID=A0A7Y6A0E0_9CELL|nr:BTAD domain-containing putative transcriptional regulator [Cellulomonas humilata]NUU17360.1 AAA family ATPase [Cellulomonas humilata]